MLLDYITTKVEENREAINDEIFIQESYSNIDLENSLQNKKEAQINKLDTVETENLSLLATRVEEQLKENTGEQYQKALEETKSQLGQ